MLNPISCKIEILKTLTQSSLIDFSSQFKSPKVTNAQTELKLKIPQLTLGGLAQIDRHWDENTKVLV